MLEISFGSLGSIVKDYQNTSDFTIFMPCQLGEEQRRIESVCTRTLKRDWKPPFDLFFQTSVLC
jgi:hypothetical protein